ncbi:MAG TPA: hemerythrin domain-containing protein [Myxococcales bacterium]|jgi:hemerythrin superfamily protein
MRSIDLLKQQHHSLEKLVSQALEARGAERVRLLGALAEELTLHSAIEEEHLYPALQQSGLGQAAERSTAQDERIRTLVSEILELKRSDPRLEGKVVELGDATREHLASEERSIFPALEEAFSAEQLEEMGQAMSGLVARLRGAELLKIADEREPARA